MFIRLSVITHYISRYIIYIIRLYSEYRMFELSIVFLSSNRGFRNGAEFFSTYKVFDLSRFHCKFILNLGRKHKVFCICKVIYIYLKYIRKFDFLEV